MPLHPTWADLALRFLLTVLAGALIGFNRGERGHAVGLRTTLIVCLASSVAMMQVNLLLALANRPAGSFVMLDLMRLPLGILSGMGFIGGGAILRRHNLVTGVTTAATLWFVTVVGLCFGGGQLVLGSSAVLIGFLVLWAMKRIENWMPLERRVMFKLETNKQGPDEQEIRHMLSQSRCNILHSVIHFDNVTSIQRMRLRVSWKLPHGRREDRPDFVTELSQHQGVRKVDWIPE